MYFVKYSQEEEHLRYFCKSFLFISLQLKHDIDSKSRGSVHDLTDNNGDISQRELEPLLDERIEDIKHRLKVEAAVVEGAKNVIKLLQNSSKDKSDKKALTEVSHIIS